MIPIDQFILAARRAHDPHEELIVQEGRVYLSSEKFSNELDTELRQKTWAVFQRAIESVFTEERIQSICDRYKFPWKQIMKDNLPFMNRYLLNFGIGSANIREIDLRELDHSLHDKTSFEIKQFYIKADPLRYLGPVESPIHMRGGPHAIHEYFKIDELTKDHRRIALCHGVERLTAHPHSYLQRLAMSIIGHESPVGTVIPAPGIKNGEIDYYKIHQVIPAGGLYAVALAPISKHSKLPPLLLFRPTRTSLGEVDSFYSWLNNTEAFIGNIGYRAAKDALNALMKDEEFRPNGKQITIGAYSLGGAHAGYFLRDNWRLVDTAVFFNSVCNSDSRVAEELANELNQLGKDEFGPSIYIYRAVTNRNGTEGDWAHFIGGKGVGWGISHPGTYVEIQEFFVSELETPTDFVSWGDLHSLRYLDGEENPYEKYEVTAYRGRTLVDRKLDNSSSKFEELRRTLGTGILFDVFTILYRLLNLILRFFGIPLLKSSI